jgi:hypothetical protein
MAVDKKSDHVGNHGGGYIDNDGQSRQFTYIDHDVKTSISTTLDIDKQAVQDELKQYRENLLAKIFAIHASLCPLPFVSFTLRGDVSEITWNETMLQDPGVPTDRLQVLYTILSNRAEITSKVI